MKKYAICLLVCFLFIVNIFGQAAATQDSLALVDLYNSTNGAGWTNSTNWLSSAPLSTWQGVVLQGNRVSSIILNNNNLAGTLPSSLGNLSQLSVIKLDTNKISGSIPASFANLTNMWIFDLGDNLLTGSIPSFFGNFLSLGEIKLNNNQLTGSIPGNLARSLQAIILNNNQLSGPVPASLDNLPNFGGMDLSNNEFTFDGLEGIARAYRVGAYYTPQANVKINEHDNQLSVYGGGTLGDNTYLWDKNGVFYARINGDSTLTITSSGTYSVIVENAIVVPLMLYSDTVSATYKTATIDSLALVDLYNSTNGANWKNNTNWLTSAPLTSWYGITLSPDSGRVTNLRLSNNNLSGSIPSSFGNLYDLRVLEMENNNLTGTLSTSFGNLYNLTSLNLSNNQLTGSIPYTCGNFTSLSLFNLANNKFTDSLTSSLGNLTNVRNFYCYNNQLTGPIPASFGNLSNIAVLDLSSNQLSGSIPSSLSGMHAIDSLALGTNQLSGTIPSSLSNLSNLVILSLSNNKLTGSIPSSLSNLSNLYLLYLDSNQLSGSIPASFGNFNAVYYLDLDNNQLSDSIPSVLANMPNLDVLSLAHNQLTGQIPSSFSRSPYLQELELNDNQLSGSIPASLTTSHSLLDLNLTNNQLSGSIPAFSLVNPRLWLSGNEFTFAGMEHLVYPSAGGNTTIISPQANINIHQDGNILYVSVGGTLSNNTYKWSENGYPYATQVGDSTLTITSVGTYSVIVKNAFISQVSDPYVTNTTNADLTLYSNSFIVSTTPVADSLRLDSIALVNLYNSTTGTGWTNNTNWLSNAPLSSWYGVTVTNGRVTSVQLESNQLKGTIPSSIGNLSHLTFLALDENTLSGSIPASLSSLTNLTDLNVAENKLSGTIPSFFIGNNYSNIKLDSNQFTFAGMENVATYNLSSPGVIQYAPQANIPLHQHGNELSVSAGGALSNNIYSWYKNGVLILTKTGDSTFTPAVSGYYTVAVTNTVATGLVLSTINTFITITPPPTVIEDSSITSCHSIVFEGVTYSTSSTVIDTVKSTTFVNADSIYRITNIQINSITPQNEDSIITNDSSVLFNGKVYTASTIVIDTLQSNGGCDSIYYTTQINITKDTMAIVIPNNIQVYPNPAHGIANIVFTTTTAGSYNIAITDLSGTTKMNLSGSSVAGQNIVPVNVSGYSSGIYIVNLTYTGGQEHFELAIN